MIGVSHAFVNMLLYNTGICGKLASATVDVDPLLTWTVQGEVTGVILAGDTVVNHTCCLKTYMSNEL